MTDTRPPDLEGTAFEDEIRTMLSRRAADVSPSPTARRLPVGADGVADSGDDAHVISLSHPARTPVRRRVLVAAAAVVIICVAALAAANVARGGDDTTTFTPATPAQGATIPAPGDPGWDPATAPPVWPVVGETSAEAVAADPRAAAGDLASPETAAAAYMDEIGGVLLAVDPSSLHVDDPGGIAEVSWSSEGDDAGPEPGATGTIHLRNVRDDAAPLWVVVGTTTESFGGQSVGLADVRTDSQVLGFTVVGSPPETGQSLSLRVGIDGSFVSTGGAPLPQGAETPDPASGELVQLSPEGRTDVEVPVEPGDRVDILVRAVGGDFLSATHMAVVVPDPPESGTPDSSTTSEPAAGSPSTTAAGEPTSEQAPATPNEPAEPEASGGVTTTAVEGTFQGDEVYRATDGTCPSLDHMLVSTFELTDGTAWDFEAVYCGSIEGDQWSGEGTFTFTTPGDATLTGSFTSAASVTSDGEPYELTITGGTGRYQGATGTCVLDNHLVDTGAGQQEQSGTFGCEISVPAA